MSLDKTNLLNSEDSEADPPMSEQVSTSDGEAIDQRIAKGPRWAQILKADGVGGLFRGLTPTFMREMPGYFCFFYAYEVIYRS